MLDVWRKRELTGRKMCADSCLFTAAETRSSIKHARPVHCVEQNLYNHTHLLGRKQLTINNRHKAVSFMVCCYFYSLHSAAAVKHTATKTGRRSAAVCTQLAEAYVHLKLAVDSLRLCAHRRQLQSLKANQFIVRLNRVRLSFNLSKWIKEIQLIPNVNMLYTWRIITHSAGVCALILHGSWIAESSTVKFRSSILKNSKWNRFQLLEI